MRQETDGVLLESFLIYEPEHEATWFKEGKPLLGALDYEERYQVVQDVLLILYRVVKQDFTPEIDKFSTCFPFSNGISQLTEISVIYQC